VVSWIRYFLGFDGDGVDRQGIGEDGCNCAGAPGLVSTEPISAVIAKRWDGPAWGRRVDGGGVLGWSGEIWGGAGVYRPRN